MAIHHYLDQYCSLRNIFKVLFIKWQDKDRWYRARNALWSLSTLWGVFCL